MASAFQTLLHATLEHLHDLHAAGVRSVCVDAALLHGLTAPPPPPPQSPAARSTSTPAPVVRNPAPRRFPIPSPLPAPPSAPAAKRPPPDPAGDASVAAEHRTLPPVPAMAAMPRPGVPPPGPEPETGWVGAPPADRAGAMEAIRERALACQLCPHLVRSRTQVVFGVGSLTAELMFVGEAPGADEDRKGEPFVGLAGQLLTRIIGAMGFTRDTVYIANVLKCRPDVPPGVRGNRTPRPEEMDTCKPYLLSQIEIIRPKVIVALGLTAVQGLLGLRTTMGAIRGRWHAFRGVPVMPTFHPSYLLRSEDGADKGFAEKRKTWEDMLQVLTRLERPISDKMRGYFLKPGGNG